MVDLMTRLDLPVLVVARTTLGTINHTLLTLEAIRARSLRIAGVLLVGERNRDNREAIESYGRVPVLGELPVLSPLTSSALAEWATSELDRDGRMEELFA
jgi:dethiobiotin synthetase